MVMDANPPPPLQGSPTARAQWQPTGWLSVVCAHTHGNTVRVWAGSSPMTALPHAEITDPGTVPIAFRARCIGCCALHTPRQHQQAKLAPRHSTRQLLKKALDSFTPVGGSTLRRRQCAHMVRTRMSCANSRSLSGDSMCSSREHVKKSNTCCVQYPSSRSDVIEVLMTGQLNPWKQLFHCLYRSLDRLGCVQFCRDICTNMLRRRQISALHHPGRGLQGSIRQILGKDCENLGNVRCI